MLAWPAWRLAPTRFALQKKPPSIKEVTPAAGHGVCPSSPVQSFCPQAFALLWP